MSPVSRWFCGHSSQQPQLAKTSRGVALSGRGRPASHPSPPAPPRSIPTKLGSARSPVFEAGHGAPKHPGAELVTAPVNRDDKEGESSLNSGARSAASAAIARLHVQASPPGVSQPLLSSHPLTHTATAHRRQLPGASARHKGDQMDPRTGGVGGWYQQTAGSRWMPVPGSHLPGEPAVWSMAMALPP